MYWTNIFVLTPIVAAVAGLAFASYINPEGAPPEYLSPHRKAEQEEQEQLQREQEQLQQRRRAIKKTIESYGHNYTEVLKYAVKTLKKEQNPDIQSFLVDILEKGSIYCLDFYDFPSCPKLGNKHLKVKYLREFHLKNYPFNREGEKIVSNERMNCHNALTEISRILSLNPSSKDLFTDIIKKCAATDLWILDVESYQSLPQSIRENISSSLKEKILENALIQMQQQDYCEMWKVFKQAQKRLNSETEESCKNFFIEHIRSMVLKKIEKADLDWLRHYYLRLEDFTALDKLSFKTTVKEAMYKKILMAFENKDYKIAHGFLDFREEGAHHRYFNQQELMTFYPKVREFLFEEAKEAVYANNHGRAMEIYHKATFIYQCDKSELYNRIILHQWNRAKQINGINPQIYMGIVFAHDCQVAKHFLGSLYGKDQSRFFVEMTDYYWHTMPTSFSSLFEALQFMKRVNDPTQYITTYCKSSKLESTFERNQSFFYDFYKKLFEKGMSWSSSALEGLFFFHAGYVYISLYDADKQIVQKCFTHALHTLSKDQESTELAKSLVVNTDFYEKKHFSSGQGPENWGFHELFNQKTPWSTSALEGTFFFNLRYLDDKYLKYAMQVFERNRQDPTSLEMAKKLLKRGEKRSYNPDFLRTCVQNFVSQDFYNELSALQLNSNGPYFKGRRTVSGEEGMSFPF